RQELPSVLLRHKSPALESRLIVVVAFARSLGQFDFVLRYFLVGNQLEEMCNTVQASAPLVVRADDVPGRVLGVRRFQHQVTRPRIGIPTRIRLEVHWAQLPLAERILDASLEASLLLVLTDL